jgi:ribosomal protein S18 acetylase RimI-like enzyme
VERAVRFYRARPDELVLPPAELGELTLSRWSPRRDGIPRGIFAGTTNFAWWAMERLGMFARDGLAVYAIHQGPRVVHRLLVTPRWYRFPFMAPGDLQLGMLWTAPAWRGRRLARQAIAAVHADYAAACEALWYVVGEDNVASIRLIETLGYRLVGRGRRTRPLGIAALGRFTLEQPPAQG